MACDSPAQVTDSPGSLPPCRLGARNCDLHTNSIPSHQPTWKCADPCQKTTFFLERAFLHFHVSWWEGSDPVRRTCATMVCNCDSRSSDEAGWSLKLGHVRHRYACLASQENVCREANYKHLKGSAILRQNMQCIASMPQSGLSPADCRWQHVAVSARCRKHP